MDQPVVLASRYLELPEAVRGEVRAFLEHREPPGPFIGAVLASNVRALGRAHALERQLFFELIDWLCAEAPAESWGSFERVEAWCAKRRRASA